MWDQGSFIKNENSLYVKDIRIPINTCNFFFISLLLQYQHIKKDMISVSLRMSSKYFEIKKAKTHAHAWMISFMIFFCSYSIPLWCIHFAWKLFTLNFLPSPSQMTKVCWILIQCNTFFGITWNKFSPLEIIGLLHMKCSIKTICQNSLIIYIFLLTPCVFNWILKA